jgi:hypothetical protein
MLELATEHVVQWVILEQFGTHADTEKTKRSMHTTQLVTEVQLRQSAMQLMHVLLAVRNFPVEHVRHTVLEVHVRQLAGLQATAWLTPLS